MKQFLGKIRDNGISYKVLFVILAVWGITMSLMVPQWQTPDESAHLTFIGNALENPDMAPMLQSDMELGWYRIMRQPEEKIDLAEWKEALTKAPTYERADVLPRGVNLSVVKHLPATVGILIGLVLHLPTFWVLTLGEWFALAVYLLLCWFTIQMLPIKREIMFLFMACPMVMQQASCISYDAIVLPICFWLIAYTMKLIYEGQKVTWKQMLIWMLPLLLITYVKLPYIVFGLLFFALPLDFGKFRWPIRIGIVAVIVLGVYVLRDYYFLKILLGCLCEPIQLLKLFKWTWDNVGEFLQISSIGNFGWLDTPFPLWFARVFYIVLVLMMVYHHFKKDAQWMKAKPLGFTLLAFCGLAFITTLSMVHHTVMMTLYGTEEVMENYNIREAIYSIPYIGGLQGRYYLPFLSLPFLALGKARVLKSENKENAMGAHWSVLVYMLILAIYTCFVLYQRYWQL